MEDHSSYLYEDLLAQIPFELQVLIFSRIKLRDLVMFASTSHYWSINAWTFTMSLGANEFSELTTRIADKASYDPGMTDLFSDPIPLPVEDVKPQAGLMAFHFLFQKVELSPQKVPHFEIEMTDGFADIKDDYFDAMTMYPGFLNEVRSLKLSRLKLEDMQRVLWYTRNLRVLEIESEQVGVFRTNLYNGTQYREAVPLVLFHGIDFSSCLNLKSITFRGFSVSEFDPIMILKTARNLKALSFNEGIFSENLGSGSWIYNLGPNMAYLAIRDSEVKYKFRRPDPVSAFFDLLSRVKVMDLRGSKFEFYRQDGNHAQTEIKQLFPQADVLFDKDEIYEFDLNN